MLTVTRKVRFSAGHRFGVEGLSAEESRLRFGPGALGAEYACWVTVSGCVDPRTGMVVNVADLKPVLDREIVLRLDGECLTPAHPVLGGRQPGCEAMVRALWDRLDTALRAVAGRLERVRLAEGRRTRADCQRGSEELMLSLTRSYEFAAAHRLHNPRLSDDENRELYGKCNNPHGHGHNYVLEVTLAGRPDPSTGLLAELPELDRLIHELVVDRYDHRHLNLDLEEFQHLVPTSENLVRVIWERLKPALPPGALRSVTVHETERNSFTFDGGDE